MARILVQMANSVPPIVRRTPKGHGMEEQLTGNERGLVLLWLVVLSFVFIWVLYSILTDGILGKKVETPLLSEDKAQDSLENCNASMEKVSCALAS
ncbi:UNVERIFIED_CONTAM: hypothetical protein Sradi_5268600 [Sesamum radiatum]|uniref:Uncharacterized protein n=1 Tax=Sesamum radiatum TaxID=300843 RepID=A0AAW2LLY5_SESRA